MNFMDESGGNCLGVNLHNMTISSMRDWYATKPLGSLLKCYKNQVQNSDIPLTWVDVKPTLGRPWQVLWGVPVIPEYYIPLIEETGAIVIGKAWSAYEKSNPSGAATALNNGIGILGVTFDRGEALLLASADLVGMATGLIFEPEYHHLSILARTVGDVISAFSALVQYDLLSLESSIRNRVQGLTVAFPFPEDTLPSVHVLREKVTDFGVVIKSKLKLNEDIHSFKVGLHYFRRDSPFPRQIDNPISRLLQGYDALMLLLPPTLDLEYLKAAAKHNYPRVILPRKPPILIIGDYGMDVFILSLAYFC